MGLIKAVDKKLLFELGFLREEDLTNTKRIRQRWNLFKTVPQLSVGDLIKRRATQQSDS